MSLVTCSKKKKIKNDFGFCLEFEYRYGKQQRVCTVTITFDKMYSFSKTPQQMWEAFTLCPGLSFISN